MKKQLYLSQFTLLIAICLFILKANANGLVISNLQRLPAPNNDRITFNISWQNSWMVSGLPGNHDAIWVFIKFQECGTSVWKHALLDTNMTNHSVAGGIAFARPISSRDRFGVKSSATHGHHTGALIRRSSFGVGNIVSQACTLRVIGSSNDGVGLEASKEYVIKVFGIEMVQVKEGGFSTNGSSYAMNGTVGTENASIPTTNWSSSSFVANPIPANFPKGVAEFYCMKYEITQGQYADFLNTIPGGDRYASEYNTATSTPNYRYTVHVGASGFFTAVAPDRACNYLSWLDFIAYLDWAALRPMTELEFQKACNGFAPAVANAYAWGNGTVFSLDTLSSATEDGTEYAYDMQANARYGNLQLRSGASGTLLSGGSNNTQRGPVSAGLFARPRTHITYELNRQNTGATYWGIMEMTGNVGERVISARGDVAAHINYTGLWGDGVLTALSDANTTAWTTDNARCIGGDFTTSAGTYLYSGDRYYTVNNFSATRDYRLGGRGIR